MGRATRGSIVVSQQKGPGLKSTIWPGSDCVLSMFSLCLYGFCPGTLGMDVCFSLALRQAGDLPGVYPTSPPVATSISSSPPVTVNCISGRK